MPLGSPIQFQLAHFITYQVRLLKSFLKIYMTSLLLLLSKDFESCVGRLSLTFSNEYG